MKFSTIAPLAFGLGASAVAIESRQSTQCCFGIDVAGGASGPLGQLYDGQNRIGPNYTDTTAATYCIKDGKITDKSGRGCILTPPTTQFQCDSGATPSPGFSISTSGMILNNGSDTFYACPATSTGIYNIYTQPVTGQDKCVKVTLSTANGQCAGSALASSSSSAAASTTPAAASTTPAAASTTPAAASTTPAAASTTPAAPTTVTVTHMVTVPGVCTSTAVFTTPAASSAASVSPSSVKPVVATSSVAPSSVKVSTSAVVYSSAVVSSSAGAPSSAKVSTSAVASSSAPASSSAVASSSAKASSLAAASTTSAAPTASASTCPADIAGSYQYPHLIVPVDSAHPKTAYGTSYFGVANSTVSSIFNFDIPASYAGQTCTLVFLFPLKKDLETSDYTVSGAGGLDFKQLTTPATQATDYDSVPAVQKDLGTIATVPGNSYVVASGACAAGQTVSYEISATGSYALNFFEDYNPSPLGLYVRTC